MLIGAVKPGAGPPPIPVRFRVGVGLGIASQARPSEQFARVFVGLSARGLGARRLSLLGGPGITRLRHRPRVDPSIHVITLLIEKTS